MPYFVVQARGPHASAVAGAVRRWREGKTNDGEAWAELSGLYLRCRDRPAPPFDLARWPGRAAYMIETWFSMYANLWFEGTLHECQAWIWEHREPDIRWEIRYEY